MTDQENPYEAPHVNSETPKSESPGPKRRPRPISVPGTLVLSLVTIFGCIGICVVLGLPLLMAAVTGAVVGSVIVLVVVSFLMKWRSR